MEALICDLGDFGFGLAVTRSWTNIGERKKGIFLILVFLEKKGQSFNLCSDFVRN